MSEKVVSDDLEALNFKNFFDLVSLGHLLRHDQYFFATILAKTTDHTLIILPNDYVPNQKP